MLPEITHNLFGYQDHYHPPLTLPVPVVAFSRVFAIAFALGSLLDCNNIASATFAGAIHPLSIWWTRAYITCSWAIGVFIQFNIAES